MQVQATLKQITNPQEGVNKQGNPWRKATIITETIGNYSKTIAFVTFNSTLDEVTKLNPGAVIDIEFDLESREYNGKWYTDAILRSATLHAQPQPAPQPKRATQTAINIVPPTDDTKEVDDLPF